MKLHLTQSVVESLKVPGQFRDDEVKGLFVRVSINRQGKLERVYKLNARIKGGKVITTTLGPHGRKRHKGVFTLEEARVWAQDLIREMRGCGDEKVPVNPVDQIKKQAVKRAHEEKMLKLEAAAKAYTLGKALDEYLNFKKSPIDKPKAKRKGELAPRTAELYRQCLNSHAADWLELPLSDINREMVLKRHQAVCVKSEAAAGNTFRALRAVFNWVIKKEEGRIVTANPVEILSTLNAWKTVEAREDIIADTQLKKWWAAVNEFESRDHADYFKLLILTGLRKLELGRMKWADVNFEERFWTVRNTKNGRDHSLPFTKHTEELLKRRFDSRAQDVYVFPGRSAEGCLKDVAHVQKLIIDKCKIEFSPHDLRRTFLSVAGRQLPEYLVKRFANHHDRQNVTQTHYVVLKDVETLREPLQAVEDFILQCAGVRAANSDHPQARLLG